MLGRFKLRAVFLFTAVCMIALAILAAPMTAAPIAIEPIQSELAFDLAQLKRDTSRLPGVCPGCLDRCSANYRLCERATKGKNPFGGRSPCVSNARTCQRKCGWRCGVRPRR